MGKLRSFEIAFENPHAVCNGGEHLLGNVLMHLNEPMTMRNLRIWFQGRAKVHWTKSSGSGSNRHTTHYRAEELYFDHSVILFGGDESSTHPAGQFTYSFELPVPVTCPSSFEGEHGYVRYVCKATIDRPWKFDHDVKSAFTVISLLNLNLEPANLQVPVEGQETKEVTCCCCASGTISAKFRIDKTGYVPGEYMVIYAEIHNNTNSSIDSTRVAIKQYSDFYGRSDSLFSSGDLKPKSESVVVAEIRRPEIEPGKTDVWNNVMLRIPALPPSGLRGCDIINLSYVVKFYANTWDEIKLTSDVVIGTVPLIQQNGGQFGVTTEQPMPSALPGISPSAPSIADQELPPPSYEECVKGQVRIQDDKDSQYTRGQMNWAPSYPIYNRPPAEYTVANSTSANTWSDTPPDTTEDLPSYPMVSLSTGAAATDNRL